MPEDESEKIDRFFAAGFLRTELGEPSQYERVGANYSFHDFPCMSPALDDEVDWQKLPARFKTHKDSKSHRQFHEQHCKRATKNHR